MPYPLIAPNNAAAAAAAGAAWFNDLSTGDTKVGPRIAANDEDTADVEPIDLSTVDTAEDADNDNHIVPYPLIVPDTTPVAAAAAAAAAWFTDYTVWNLLPLKHTHVPGTDASKEADKARKAIEAIELEYQLTPRIH